MWGLIKLLWSGHVIFRLLMLVLVSMSTIVLKMTWNLTRRQLASLLPSHQHQSIVKISRNHKSQGDLEAVCSTFGSIDDIFQSGLFLIWRKVWNWIHFKEISQVHTQTPDQITDSEKFSWRYFLCFQLVNILCFSAGAVDLEVFWVVLTNMYRQLPNLVVSTLLGSEMYSFSNKYNYFIFHITFGIMKDSNFLSFAKKKREYVDIYFEFPLYLWNWKLMIGFTLKKKKVLHKSFKILIIL